MPLRHALRVEALRDLRWLEDGRWDGLIAGGPSDQVFARASWLLAWSAAFAPIAEPVFVAARGERGAAGAAAFVRRGGALELLGRGACDYADVGLRAGMGEDDASRVTTAIVDAALRLTPVVLLPSVVASRGTPARLRRVSGLYVTTLRDEPAPAMDMALADASLRKKSLRRHVAGLARLGEVTVDVATTPAAIEAALPSLWAMHVERWSGTPTPSQFNDAAQRKHYTLLARRLGAEGHARLLTVRLAGRPVAAHFGACYRGVYTWYKPAFDPALAAHSPGEVLLHALLRDAQACGAVTFDFTVGGEGFKWRFASREERVVDLHVTRDAWRAAALRGYLAARDAAKRRLGEDGDAWARLRALAGRG